MNMLALSSQELESRLPALGEVRFEQGEEDTLGQVLALALGEVVLGVITNGKL